MQTALDNLVAQARRRMIWNLVLRESVKAACLALAAAVLLVVAGTQILDWYWPLLLFAAAFAYGLYRIRPQVPSAYTVAQRIDNRLSLNDEISTAFHYAQSHATAFSLTLRDAQRRRAEETASGVPAEVAVPWNAPRGVRYLAALAGLFIAVFFLRYGIQKSLDLTKPIVALNLDFGSARADSGGKKRDARDLPDSLVKQISIESAENEQGGTDPAPDSATSLVETPDVNNDGVEAVNRPTDKGAKSGDQKDGANEGSEEGDGSSPGEKNANDAPSDKQGRQGQKGERNAKNQQAQQPGENSSLMDKMRDALANMMNKLKSDQKESGRQQASNTKAGQSSMNPRQQQQKSGQPSPGKQGDSQASGEQKGDDQNQSGDPSQSSQGKPGDKESEQSASNQPKSGMGTQDGNKDVQLAEQQAAMGKISEILGKRAQNIAGDVMIEVSSGKQQLRTQYTSRSAASGDSGGEIHRDEVPLIYQQYIQRYFEEVRREKAPARPPTPSDARTVAKPGNPAPAGPSQK